MPEYEKEKRVKKLPFAPSERASTTEQEQPESVRQRLLGAIDEIDDKHFFLALGCKHFIVHNLKEAMVHVEKEVGRWMEGLRRQRRVSRHLQKQTQKLLEKGPKKKASEKKLKLIPEPSLTDPLKGEDTDTP